MGKHRIEGGYAGNEHTLDECEAAAESTTGENPAVVEVIVDTAFKSSRDYLETSSQHRPDDDRVVTAPAETASAESKDKKSGTNKVATMEMYARQDILGQVATTFGLQSLEDLEQFRRYGAGQEENKDGGEVYVLRNTDERSFEFLGDDETLIITTPPRLNRRALYVKDLVARKENVVDLSASHTDNAMQERYIAEIERLKGMLDQLDLDNPDQELPEGVVAYGAEEVSIVHLSGDFAELREIARTEIQELKRAGTMGLGPEFEAGFGESTTHEYTTKVAGFAPGLKIELGKIYREFADKPYSDFSSFIKSLATGHLAVYAYLTHLGIAVDANSFQSIDCDDVGKLEQSDNPYVDRIAAAVTKLLVKDGHLAGLDEDTLHALEQVATKIGVEGDIQLARINKMYEGSLAPWMVASLHLNDNAPTHESGASSMYYNQNWLNLQTYFADIVDSQTFAGHIAFGEVLTDTRGNALADAREPLRRAVKGAMPTGILKIEDYVDNVVNGITSATANIPDRAVTAGDIDGFPYSGTHSSVRSRDSFSYKKLMEEFSKGNDLSAALKAVAGPKRTEQTGRPQTHSVIDMVYSYAYQEVLTTAVKFALSQGYKDVFTWLHSIDHDSPADTQTARDQETVAKQIATRNSINVGGSARDKASQLLKIVEALQTKLGDDLHPSVQQMLVLAKEGATKRQNYDRTSFMAKLSNVDHVVAEVQSYVMGTSNVASYGELKAVISEKCESFEQELYVISSVLDFENSKLALSLKSTFNAVSMNESLPESKKRSLVWSLLDQYVSAYTSATTVTTAYVNIKNCIEAYHRLLRKTLQALERQAA